MSEKIQPGDLVMVVKPAGCCGSVLAIGEIHRVADVLHSDLECNSCKKRFQGMAAYFESGDINPVRELKRIPPLDGEDVAVKEKEVVV